MQEIVKTQKKSRLSAQKMAFCALFTALIVIGGFIRIPIPYIPITFQVMFVLLAGMLLGRRLRALCVLIYIAIGLIGFPVFTQGGGPSYVLQPTFGYLIGFAIGAYVTGFIIEKSEKLRFGRLYIAQLAGIAFIYACGMTYFYFMSNYYVNNPISLSALFINSFFATLPKDLVLSVLGAWLGLRLLPFFRKYMVQTKKPR